MKKLLVAFVVALAMVFVIPETKADYPYGFDKIKEICDKEQEEVLPDIGGVKRMRLVVPDTSEGNPDGTIILLAVLANDDHMIAVGIIIRTSEGDPIVATMIVHSEGENVVIDLLTKEEYPIEGRTIGLFITEWLRLYNKAMGTPV